MLALVIALAALRSKALTIGGAGAAFAVGTITFATGTVGTAVLLLAFFVSSTLLSRAGKARKSKLVDIGKGGARDAWQVLANGGVGSACLLMWAFADHGAADSGWFIAFAGSYAAATSDTWGTEIGTLADGLPTSILTGKPLATGLSGGVSRAGTAAEVAGAVLIALLTPVSLFLALRGGSPIALRVPAWFPLQGQPGMLEVFAISLIVPVFVAGFIGALADSLLGATIQERRWCPSCERECETDPHSCGTPTQPHRGLRWMSNDAVNFAATATGAVVAALVWHALHVALG